MPQYVHRGPTERNRPDSDHPRPSTTAATPSSGCASLECTRSIDSNTVSATHRLMSNHSHFYSHPRRLRLQYCPLHHRRPSLHRHLLPRDVHPSPPPSPPPPASGT